MRTDTGTGHRVTHHQVVNTRVRDEIEMREQVVRGLRKMLRVLNQYGPKRALRRREILTRKRAVRNFPLAAVIGDKTTFSVVARSQCEDGFLVEWVVEMREGMTYQEGFLLPVFAQELLCAESPQMHKRLIVPAGFSCGYFHQEIIIVEELKMKYPSLAK